MSDYLANLVQRTLGRERTIQPRVPSLLDPVKSASPSFEQPAELFHQPSDYVTDDTVLEGSPSTRLTRNNPLSDDTRQAPRKQFNNPDSRLIETTADQIAARPPEVRPDVSDRVQAQHSPNREERRAVPLHEDQPPPFSTAAVQQHSYLTPRARKHAPSRVQPDLPRSKHSKAEALPSNASAGKTAIAEPAARNAAMAKPPASEINRQREEPSPAARSKSENSLPEPNDQASDRAATILRPRIFPHIKSPAPAGPPAPAASASTDSVVNVTIGRIEVRATPPPARSGRTATASSPVMTLSDYLRARANGGGR